MNVKKDVQTRSNINIIKDSKGKRGKNNVIKLGLNYNPRKFPGNGRNLKSAL